MNCKALLGVNGTFTFVNRLLRNLELQAYGLRYGIIKKSPLCKGGLRGIVMQRKHNKAITPYAKELRKNMTKEERRLWYDFLRNYPVRFLRQKVLGRYIVDFYCATARLVIELDGSEHYSDEGERYDEERTKFLQGYGLKIVRFSNIDIHKNFKGVCEYIHQIVQQSLRP